MFSIMSCRKGKSGMPFIGMWIIVSVVVVLLVLGFLGSVLPVLPGPPLSYAAMLVWYFSSPGSLSSGVVVVFGILTVVVLIMDYVAPTWLAKYGGGSRRAVWGTAIGTVIGLFFLPWGLVAGPFLGAFLGEQCRREGASVKRSFRVAGFSLLAFVLTTGAKLVLCGAIAVYLLVAVFK